MRLLRILVVAIAALFVCAIVPNVGRAEEDPAVVVETVETTEATSAEAEVSDAGVVAQPEPVWFGNVQLWEVVGAIVAAIWLIVKQKIKMDEDWQVRLTGFIEAGVQVTYDEFIRQAKKASADGKLTPEQINEARGKAWDAAKVFARDQGIDLVKQVAAEQIPVLITRVANGMKNKK